MCVGVAQTCQVELLPMYRTHDEISQPAFPPLYLQILEVVKALE